MIKRLLHRIRNMNRLWGLFILALILGIFSAVLSSNYLQSREKNIGEELKKQMAGGPIIEVIVSTANLPVGAVLGQTLVKREVQADLVEEDTLLPSDLERVAGTKLTRPLRAGYPINPSYFTEKVRTITDAVEIGLRAITIEIDEINSMAQMVKPGDRVDLMLITPDKADPEGGVEVIMVLQNVKVMATGQSVAARENDPRNKNPQAPAGNPQTYSNFTFEVTPQNAAIIALAQNSGKIRAVLRKGGDNETVVLTDVNTRRLLNAEQKNAEKRKLAASSRMQDMNSEESFTSSVSRKRAEIEYILGGMGSADVVSMAQTLGGQDPSLQPSKPQTSKAGGSATPADKAQNTIIDAVRNSGIPAGAMGSAARNSK
jgi:pilus assembly protein CpaB